MVLSYHKCVSVWLTFNISAMLSATSSSSSFWVSLERKGGVDSGSPAWRTFLKEFAAFRKDSGNYQNILSDVFQCKACARLFPPPVEMPLEARLGRKTRAGDCHRGFGLRSQNSQETLAGGPAAPGHRLGA